MKNILILCTGNSARSIMAEALLNQFGLDRVRAYSAGSKPKGNPHPAALAQLLSEGMDISLLRSKSWDEFAMEGAPKMDIVITVCDSAAGEACPIWPGAPVTAHWGIPDPADAEGDEQAAAFELGYERLKSRVLALMDVPFETMSAEEVKASLFEIGKSGEGATQKAMSGE